MPQLPRLLPKLPLRLRLLRILRLKLLLNNKFALIMIGDVSLLVHPFFALFNLMEYKELSPDEKLLPFVKCFVTIRNSPCFM